MALSNKALQRKREKKKNKRKIKVSNSISTTVIAYQNWSLYEGWMPIELWETGIGQIIIARKNNQGDIAVGIYLIDTYCLGIKDCFVRLTNTYEYKNLLEQVGNSCGEMKLVDPTYANTLIIKAAEYADQFGFKPHRDFAKARNLLRGIPIDETQEFSFGKDGKPFYVQGPHESPADIKRILKTLEANQGNENYHFLIGAPHPNQLIENET
jgi:hypothetical protein